MTTRRALTIATIAALLILEGRNYSEKQIADLVYMVRGMVNMMEG